MRSTPDDLLAPPAVEPRVVEARVVEAGVDTVRTTPGDWAAFVDRARETGDLARDGGLVGAAGAATRLLPAAVHDALVAFADRPGRSGVLLLRGVPLGDVPPTPPTPTSAPSTPIATFALLTVARRLGQPVGYAPEHGGDVVQHIVPTPDAGERQVSTSSAVELMFHTETAFHPHRPRYLVLLCLRGDPAAATTTASIHDLVALLAADDLEVARQPRFRTAVDESFLGGRPNQLGAPHPLLTGSPDEPTFVFDADLTVGVDPVAEQVVRRIATVIGRHHGSTVLEAGDVLVVDNNLVVHGRSPFTPRFDGTDRWLQRTFVVTDLAPSAAERCGRVITTRFGARLGT